MRKSEYAKAGVDYKKIEPFKMAMKQVGKKTLKFPNSRGVFVESDDHGTTFWYDGPRTTHRWSKTTEGLGNKNWIAEWMYKFSGTGRTYYEGIGIDNALMAVNDLIACGAMPVVYTDEVAVGNDSWFMDKKRAEDLAKSFYIICKEVEMALPAGESPALKYLLRSEPPVESAPSLSGCATGIIAPATNRITGKKLRSGDRIIGVTSSGLHANGISLVIKRALELPDKFLTKLPNGKILGEEALIPTRSYVKLVEALLWNSVDIHALVPGTGGGVAKVAFDKRQFCYKIYSWPLIPPLFEFICELGVPLNDCITTFNWGVGYYIFVPRCEVKRVIDIGRACGYEIMEIGRVEEGKRKVIFSPKCIKFSITLPPPGE